MNINCVDKCQYQVEGKCNLLEINKKDKNKKNYNTCINLI